MHGLFMDNKMPVPTCDKLSDEFLALRQNDFEITRGGLMETFLGMNSEVDGKVIRLLLESYIQEVLNDYKHYVKKSLWPKRVPSSSPIAGAPGQTRDYLVLLIPTGVTALPAALRLAICVFTTDHLSSGAQSCRRPPRCQQPRRSTLRTRRLWRCYTFTTAWNT